MATGHGEQADAISRSPSWFGWNPTAALGIVFSLDGDGDTIPIRLASIRHRQGCPRCPGCKTEAAKMILLASEHSSLGTERWRPNPVLNLIVLLYCVYCHHCVSFVAVRLLYT